MDDDNVLERGPHFLVMPNSIVVVGQTRELAVLECLAYANPEPTYKWFRGDGFTEEVRLETFFFWRGGGGGGVCKIMSESGIDLSVLECLAYSNSGPSYR